MILAAPSDSDAPAARIPVTVLTGFLGSGKTTVLNHLVRQPEFADALVIINEFGAMALDHSLVAQSRETAAVELAGGCVCCTVRGDLVRTLRDVTWRFARNNRRQFGRVLIETSGLADPAPIVHTLLRHPQLASQYRLDGVVTTVDLSNTAATLDRHIEAVRQIAMADTLLLTKADLATPAQRTATDARLAHINPGAPRHAAQQGGIAPAVLLGLRPHTAGDAVRWLNAAVYATPAAHAYAAGAGAGGSAVPGGDGPLRHDACIRAFCCTLDTPIDMTRLPHWQAALQAVTGERLLRFKGIFRVAGDVQPWALHGVRHVFHPPERLPGALAAATDTDAGRHSRLVFITEDVSDAAIGATLPLLTA